MKKCSLLAGLFGFLWVAEVSAQSPVLNYQGQLRADGTPAEGLFDLRFTLYLAESGGAPLVASVTNAQVSVTGGLFTVSLDFGAAVFDGSDRWLEIGVRPQGSLNAYQALVPRQRLGATPYAVRARVATTYTGSIAAAQLSGTIAQANVAPGTITSAMLSPGVGAGLVNLNASQLTSGSVPSAALNNAWKRAGNAGTTGGVDFLGTLDSQPLELRVNNQRGLRLEYVEAGVETNVNLVGGYSGNVVSNGVVGATIGGGGSAGAVNKVDADFGTVGGGKSNTAGFVGAAVAGGIFNHATRFAATVGGGDFNTSSGERATVGGGIFNSATDYGATVSGGGDNVASGFTGTIGGGNVNVASGSYSTIGGGFFNSASAFGATVGGGQLNQAIGEYATVVGGLENVATNHALAAGHRAKAAHTGTFVWADSTPSDFSSSGSNQFLIRASGGVGIGTSAPGGTLHVRESVLARIALLERDTVTSNTDVAAAKVRATRDGDMGDGFGGGISFELADNTSVANAGFIGIRRDGGSDNTTALVFQTANGGAPTTKMTLDRIGNLVTTGAVNPPSDRNVKQDFAPMDGKEVLERVVGLPIQTWAYTNAASIRHIGPVAQDFHAAFGLGSDDKHIATVDADGVALSAIQGLNRKLEEQVDRKEREITELKARLSALERIVSELSGRSP